ncbi:MAG: hypothetical protein LBV21_02875 [Candidatus Adiutrix sp.]|jgi:hypothetical protein|nr:hypothetical protein [Candidatus Adiutrix sp.]
MTFAITVKEAKAALNHLRKLTPAQPRLDDDLNLSLKETVFLMAPELSRMVKRGFTLKELAAGLNGQNIPVKTTTLNRYLTEYKFGQSQAESGVEPGSVEIFTPAKEKASREEQTTGSPALEKAGLLPDSAVEKYPTSNRWPANNPSPMKAKSIFRPD